jgi:hypothetical protein
MIKHLTPKTKEEILKSFKSKNDHQIMMSAVTENYPLIVKMLLDKTLNAWVYKDEFVYAIVYKRAEIIKIFLSRNIDLDNILTDYGQHCMNQALGIDAEKIYKDDYTRIGWYKSYKQTST